MGFPPGRFQEGQGQGDTTADQVRNYLQREEDYLLDSILKAFHISLEEPFTSRRSEGDAIASRFAEAIDRVIEQVDKFSGSEVEKLASEELEIIIAHVNAAFRHYEELLEGCASQLFSELEKMRVDQLTEDTVKGVKRVKDKLIAQIDDCNAQIGRLEKRLRRGRSTGTFPQSLIRWVKSYFTSIIDPSVVRKLRKVRKLVDREYDQLQVRFAEYQQLDQWASEKRKRLSNLRIFSSLEEKEQEKYAEVYRLLKMLKRSQRASELIGKELNRLLGNVVQVDEAVRIFDRYNAMLRGAFFVVRRQLPQVFEQGEDLKEVKSQYTTDLQSLRREVHILGSTVFRYRDFVLKTHPDPYVRARLGFAESTVGPEPETTKRLVRLGHRVEGLNAQMERVIAAIDRYDPTHPDLLELGHFDQMIDDLDQLVFEAKHPVKAAEAFQDVLSELALVDELSHFDEYRMMGVEKVLRLALRLDRFNLLPRDKKFAELYEIHLQVRGPAKDPVQAEYLKRLLGAHQELVLLRSESGARYSRDDYLSVVGEWEETAEKLVSGLEEYIDRLKQDRTTTFSDLTAEVRQRRFEVLEFLHAYRSMLHLEHEMKEEGSARMHRFLDRIHQVEGDFTYIVARVGRSHGPMSLEDLRALENL